MSLKRKREWDSAPRKFVKKRRTVGDPMIEAEVKKVLSSNLEKKYFDVQNQAVSVTNTFAAPVNLCNPANGTGPNNIIGNDAVLKSVQYRMMATVPPGTTIQEEALRVVVFLDISGNTAVNTMFQDYTDFNSPINMAYSKELIVLSDEVVTFNQTVGYNGTVPYIAYSPESIKMFKGRLGNKMQVKTSGRSVPYMTYISLNGTVDVNYYARTRFTDA